MTVEMEWQNMSFKGKDLIQFVIYAIMGILFVTQIKSEVERQGDKITVLQEQLNDLRNDSKGISKDNSIIIQALQTQINRVENQALLNKQEIENLKQAIK